LMVKGEKKKKKEGTGRPGAATRGINRPNTEKLLAKKRGKKMYIVRIQGEEGGKKTSSSKGKRLAKGRVLQKKTGNAERGRKMGLCRFNHGGRGKKGGGGGSRRGGLA